MRKLMVVFLGMVCVAGLGGCLKQRMLVKVNPDGSGTISNEVVFSKVFVGAVQKGVEEERKEAAAAAGEQDAEQIAKMEQDIFFNEEMIADMSEALGENIKYAGAKKIDDERVKGFVANYTFDKISDVKLNLDSLAVPFPQPGVEKQGRVIKFEFAKDAEASKLKVLLPSRNADAEGKELDAEVAAKMPLTSEEKKQFAKDFEFLGIKEEDITHELILRKFLDGVGLELDVEVAGDLLKSDASAQSTEVKERFKLVSLDYNVLLESDSLCAKLTADDSMNVFDKIMSTKAQFKGLTYEEKSEVTIEFKAK